VHEWWGNNAYSQNRAKMLAELGYTAFAVDMYGNGLIVDNPEVYQQTLMQHGVPEDYARMFTAFAVAFAADTMNVPTTELTQLLGRKPTSVQEFLLTKFKK
jgi:dienelactone hydrolase